VGISWCGLNNGCPVDNKVMRRMRMREREKWERVEGSCSGVSSSSRRSSIVMEMIMQWVKLA